MNRRLSLVSFLLSGLFCGTLIDTTAHAADHSAVMPFMVDDVVAVAQVDLAGIDVSAVLDELRNLHALPQDQWDDAASTARNVQRWLSQLVDSGATRAYILLRVSDLEHSGPSWVISLADNADAEAVLRLIKEPIAGLDRPGFFPHEFRLVDGAVLAAMDKAQLERLATHRIDRPRQEVGAALAALGDSTAGLLVLGDADSRRVLREMFPRLPEPFRQIDGRMIADDILWGGVAVDLPPKLRVTIHVRTSGAEVARALQQSAVKTLELTKAMLTAKLASVPEKVPASSILQAFGLLEPKVEGTAVTLILGDDAEGLTLVRDLLAPSFADATEAAQRNRRFNKFKQLGLAFWNHQASHKEFVQRANYDQNGRPLLSWRVHLLPYLEQQTLYDEFHLDEPWDSPHNRKLIARMPDVYADPSGEVRAATGAGRTTFVAPVANETLFPPRDALPDGKPLKVRDVTDGTSKTIMFVEVVPQRAVVWTRPEDWNVDLDHPLHGLKRSDRSGFTVARCDASVQFVSNDVDPKKMVALLTRAASDRVD